MIGAYDEYGNVVDLVEWEKNIRTNAIDEFIHKFKMRTQLRQMSKSECISTMYDIWYENTEEKQMSEDKNVTEEILDHIGEDVVNHPKHYEREGAMETIDEMLMIFGSIEVMSFCKLNAWKYRARAIFKNGEEDIKKSDWYLNKYKELEEKYRNSLTKP